MPAKKQWIGKTFGSWTVISEVENPRKVLCRCICGVEREVARCSLSTKVSRSCGCQRAPRPSEWADKIDTRGPDDCWEFQGYRNEWGYGVAGVGLVHRAVYERDIGPIPENMLVCHTCDNPACCNPAHLWLGTNEDNMKDMKAKGRASSGWHTQSEEWKAAKREQIRALGKKPKSDQTKAKMAEARRKAHAAGKYLHRKKGAA